MKQLTSFTTGGLSPCVWGHQKGRGIYIRISGSIPMCMGPPPQKNTLMIKKWVYPHVYCDTFITLPFHQLFIGISIFNWVKTTILVHIIYIVTKIHYRHH